MLNSRPVDESKFDFTRSWKDSLPYSIKRFFEDQNIFHLKRIFWKIKNIVRWIPILWDDRDWDYSSLYIIMKKKIQYMKECEKENNVHMDWEQVSNQMQSVEDALDRLVNDCYASDSWDQHYAQFPRKLEWIDLPDGNKQLVPMSEEAGASFHRICDEEEILKKLDEEKVGNLFTSMQIRGWWN